MLLGKYITKYKYLIILGLLLLGFLSVYIPFSITDKANLQSELNEQYASPIFFLNPGLYRSIFEPFIWLAVIAVLFWPFKSRKQAITLLVTDFAVLLFIFLALCAVGGDFSMLAGAVVVIGLSPFIHDAGRFMMQALYTGSYLGGTIAALGIVLFINKFLLGWLRK